MEDHYENARYGHGQRAAVGTELVGIIGLTLLLVIVGAIRGLLHADHLFSTGTVPSAGWLTLGKLTSAGPFMLAFLLGAFTIVGFEAAANLAEETQDALFGQACYAPGNVKVTYGTGAFILMNTGHTLPTSHFGLVPTVAWSLPDSIIYALDGGIYVAGAAVQWLRDGLGIISSAEESNDETEGRYKQWQRAVERAGGWAMPDAAQSNIEK